MSVRLFAAIDLDPAVRAALEVQVDLLRRQWGAAANDVRWVPSDRRHLTLVFVGAAAEASVARLEQVFAERIPLPPFELCVRTLGVFPARGPARVLWAGVEEPAGRLPALYDTVRARMVDAGLAPDDKPLHAHVTLGRLRDRGSAAATVRKLVAATPVDAGCCGVDCVTLYESRATGRDHAYRPLARAPLWDPSTTSSFRS